MNKLYILGALLLSQVEAGKMAYSTTASTIATTAWGSYTYTVSGDCYSSATATTLGMNNRYYQYYTYDIAAGGKSFALATPTTGGAANPAHTYTYNACSHTHLYNWMAVPVMGTAAVQAGLGTSVVAYGYVLTGTAVTSCANTIATGTLYSSTAKTFSGAAYQTYTAVATLSTATTANTIAQSARSKQGHENFDALTIKASTTITTFIAPVTTPAVIAGTEGLATSTATNHYWDFMQTNVFQGMTQFGRGGGASTSPCGWYVVYAYETPGPTSGAIVSMSTVANGLAQGAEDVYPSVSKATIHMWTDNSIMTVASSIVLSALATILF